MKGLYVIVFGLLVLGFLFSDVSAQQPTWEQALAQLQSMVPDHRRAALPVLSDVVSSAIKQLENSQRLQDANQHKVALDILESVKKGIEKLLFTEPQAEIRQQAVVLLGMIENEGSLNYLRRARDIEPVKEVRDEIDRAIVRIERVVASVRLDSRHYPVRQKAISDLAMMVHSQDWAVNQLVRTVRFDPFPDCRVKAATTLGDFGVGAKNAIPELQEALAKEPADEVVQAIGLAIDKIKVAIGSEMLGSNDPLSRAQGVQFWTEVAARHASGVVRLSYWLRSDPDPNVRETIVRALGELGKPEAIAALRAAMKEDSSPIVRLRAEEALWKIEQVNPDLPEPDKMPSKTEVPAPKPEAEPTPAQ